MKKITIGVYVSLFWCAYTTAHAAQAPASTELHEARRMQEHIIMQEQERQHQQLEEFLYGREAPPATASVPQFGQEAVPPGAPCAEIKSIEISGATLFSSRQLRRVVSPYENQCLSLEEVNNILRELTNLYIDAGYVTARAFVDTSVTKEGVLHILMVEGKLEKVILNDGDRNLYYRGVMAFPGLEGKPLNLRDIEQGIDQLNRFPSGDATLELTPGETVGGTIAKVTVPPIRSWRLGGGADNLGQRSSGQYQHNLFLEKDNAVGLGDQVALYWSESAPYLEKIRTGKRDSRKNYSFSAYASVPYGYWTFSANMSHFAYNSPIYGMNSVYTSSGTSKNYGLQAERVFHRDADSKTSLAVSLAGRDVKNYIEGIYLESSSYFLASLTTGVNHSRRFLGGSLSAGLDHTQGLPAFGTKKQEEYSREAPRSLFHKFSSHIQWYRPFHVHEQSFYYHISGYGQISKQTLYSAERISIGSKYSVRGFHESSLSGDQGGYIRNELGWDIPWPESWLKSMPMNRTQLYASYDIGGLIKDKDDPYERGTLQGVSAGLRTTGPLALDVSVAKATAAPHFIKKRDTEFYMSLRYTF